MPLCGGSRVAGLALKALALPAAEADAAAFGAAFSAVDDFGGPLGSAARLLFLPRAESDPRALFWPRALFGAAADAGSVASDGTLGDMCCLRAPKQEPTNPLCVVFSSTFHATATRSYHHTCNASPSAPC